MRSKAGCKKDLKSSVIGCKSFFILCFCLEEHCVFPRQTEEMCSMGRQKSKYDVCQLLLILDVYDLFVLLFSLAAYKVVSKIDK